jgi:hypothetical protein
VVGARASQRPRVAGGDSDLAWDIGGYDAARFELHVLDERSSARRMASVTRRGPEKLGPGTPERLPLQNHW